MRRGLDCRSGAGCLSVCSAPPSPTLLGAFPGIFREYVLLELELAFPSTHTSTARRRGMAISNDPHSTLSWPPFAATSSVRHDAAAARGERQLPSLCDPDAGWSEPSLPVVLGLFPFPRAERPSPRRIPPASIRADTRTHPDGIQQSARAVLVLYRLCHVSMLAPETAPNPTLLDGYERVVALPRI
uniref:Uncharacterized protein n=1 Tax=Mycena chlorophos TaxID=658473 RepID=A0ABQ0LER9_MYCCL|nr:predicted protein [Mycena chlorophos]